MLHYLVLVGAVLSPLAEARPQVVARQISQQQYSAGGAGVTPIPIVSQTEIVGGDGSFNFSYETGNGISYQQSGYVKANPVPFSGTSADGSGADNSIQVLAGQFSYTAPDGQVISLKYVADENGFQPQGAHLPTAPPIPADIQRALSLLPSSSSGQSIQNPSGQASGPIPYVEILRPSHD